MTITIPPLLADLILLGMSLHLVTMAVCKRLWLFPCHPARFVALNAVTLTVLGVAIILPNDPTAQFAKLTGYVRICAVMGAFMPSIATADLANMWSSVAGVGWLVIIAVVNISLQVYTGNIHEHMQVLQHIAVAVSMVMLLAVLFTHAIALEAMMS